MKKKETLGTGSLSVTELEREILTERVWVQRRARNRRPARGTHEPEVVVRSRTTSRRRGAAARRAPRGRFFLLTYMGQYTQNVGRIARSFHPLVRVGPAGLESYAIAKKQGQDYDQ